MSDPKPHLAETRDVRGLSVHIEGSGPTVLMLHGWPDSTALWDGSVAALRDGYRCVRVSLPGFELAKAPRPTSVDEMCELLAAVADAVSPGEPLTLLLHDWGCLFGYEYAARNPVRVARVIGADIGDTNSAAYLHGLRLKEKLMIAGYQLWLAAAWKLGAVLPGLATRMTRFMARNIGCRTPPEQIGWQMNYPYAMQWLGSFGGLRSIARVRKVLGPRIPTLYCFGKRKPFMFHSENWLAALAATPGCRVQGFDAGHWFMLQKPAEFNATVRAWLDQATAA